MARLHNLNYSLKNLEKSRLMIPKRYLYVFFSLICVLSVFALLEYPGQSYIYILFTVISNVLLYFGFRKHSIVFDTFIGVFLWLGFWLKLTIRVAFLDSQFSQAVGSFDGSGAAFDRALLVTSCGFLGLLLASFLREKFIFTYPEKLSRLSNNGLFKLYQNHRKVILAGFVILIVFIATTNMYFGIYQRGEITRTVLPYGLNGIYKWLLLFGLASVTAQILRYEFTINRKTTYPVVVIGMLEGFFSNVSLLSRGMILNISALVYGVTRSMKLDGIKTRFRFLVVSFLIFLALFSCSVVITNNLRQGQLFHNFDLGQITTIPGQTTQIFFLDRWVGIEGVMAISSYPGQGWGLWKKAWKETYSDNKTSFYDMNLITSPYRDTDMTKHHYISLPGIIAFCFYPGSFLFLFGCMMLVGTLAAAIEISAFKLGGKNIVLCALLAQVVAYRFSHFGYVPAQSYLLFGAVYLNLFMIYFSNKYLVHYYNKKMIVT